MHASEAVLLVCPDPCVSLTKRQQSRYYEIRQVGGFDGAASSRQFEHWPFRSQAHLSREFSALTSTPCSSHTCTRRHTLYVNVFIKRSVTAFHGRNKLFAQQTMNCDTPNWIWTDSSTASETTGVVVILSGSRKQTAVDRGPRSTHVTTLAYHNPNP